MDQGLVNTSAAEEVRKDEARKRLWAVLRQMHKILDLVVYTKMKVVENC